MGNKNKKINIKLNQELVTKETCKESKHLDVDKSRSQSQTDYSRTAPTLCEDLDNISEEQTFPKIPSAGDGIQGLSRQSLM